MDKHKEKCRKLKEIRKKMADRLGIDLHQRECTYEGECSGTCPKCRQEEETLNKALLGKTAAAVAISTSVMLTACGPMDETGTASAPPVASQYGENETWEKVKDSVADYLKRLSPDRDRGWGDLAGDVEIDPNQIEGGLELPPEELEGDVCIDPDAVEGKIQVPPGEDIAGMEENIEDVPWVEIDGLREELPKESGE